MITGKRLALQLLISLLPASVFAQNFGGNPPSIKWRQINNAQGRIIFPEGMDSQANRINNVNLLLSKTTAYSIGGKQHKWNILLLNQTTIPNAYVRLAPVMSELFMTPDPNNFNSGSLRWDDNLFIHENRHMQQLSNFNQGLTRVFSFLLGQEGQLLANGITIPDYFFEGDAVWQETLVSGQGRGRMPAFYNGMKALPLANKKYSWMKLRSGSLKDFTPSYYELGYQLVAYGYEKYGDNFWRKVTADAVRFKGLFFAFNKAIERHSGKSYQQFREDALQYFADRSITKSTNDQPLHFITNISKNNVTDYLFPAYLGDDTILVTKKSYKEVSSFYLLSKGKEKRIRVKDVITDDYFSYRNGKIVYAAYQSDPRWGNRNYSVLKLLDIYTNQQRQLGTQSRYFSPDINEAGDEVLAVNVNPDGTNYLHRINANTGLLVAEIPNPNNYFFTQTKYLDKEAAISAVRNAAGKMSLVKINLVTGETNNITPFTFNVIGYPCIKGDTVYFSAMNINADKVFAVRLSDHALFRVTDNINGIYQPAVNSKQEMVVSAFTADGSRLATINLRTGNWQSVSVADFSITPDLYTAAALSKTGSKVLYNVVDSSSAVTPYKKSFQLFNFHSWRPEVNDPEYSYHFYSDNVLSSFSNSLTYTYNRSDQSHTLGFYEAFAGWLPILTIGGEHSFNRSVLDTAAGGIVQFNSAKLAAGLSVPLSFVGGRTNKFVNFGGGYNIEQFYYRGIGKNVFDNLALKYANFFLTFSNANRQARQHINPRWAQSISLGYRDAVNIVNSYKFVVNSAFYFPGLSTNHSLVLNASFQKRDTIINLFSNTFSYSRGYDALSTRRMYKLGANYHLPLWYPDWGFGNMIFFQRIRANAFYDHTIARARVNGILSDIKNRSVGTEIYFDTKVWNALPVSFGFRYSHLLDRNLQNPGVRNLWEFIVPIGIIPD